MHIQSNYRVLTLFTTYLEGEWRWKSPFSGLRNLLTKGEKSLLKNSFLLLKVGIRLTEAYIGGMMISRLFESSTECGL